MLNCILHNTNEIITDFIDVFVVPIGILPGPDKIVVKPNHQAFLHCEVYGNPKPSVSWQKGLSDLRSDGRYETFSNGTLLIRRATEQDVDSYTCRANNRVTTPVQRTIKLELRGMNVKYLQGCCQGCFSSKSVRL